jgi:hypothetical protein
LFNVGRKRRRFTLLFMAVFLLTLLIFPQAGMASDAGMLTIYEKLKGDYPEFIQRLYDGGASDSHIETFLIDLDIEVRKHGDALTKENFNSLMFESVVTILQWRKHRTMFSAMSTSFFEEINYTLETGQLHADLIPLRNAVRDSIFAMEPGDGEPYVPVEPIIPVVPIDNGTFIDIVGHWAARDIEQMVKLSLVMGVSATEFAPNRAITRAEFTALLIRAVGLETGQVAGKFTDVPANKWYYSVVNTAAEAGLVSGYGTTFGPDDPITREQMAVMISRALVFKDENVELTANEKMLLLAVFVDRKDISVWAGDGVAQAAYLGIVKGRSSNMFVPRGIATRAEAAVMILRMFNLF